MALLLMTVTRSMWPTTTGSSGAYLDDHGPPSLASNETHCCHSLSEPEVLRAKEDLCRRERRQEGLTHRADHPVKGPTPLRMLLVWHNLTGHHTPTFILWLFAHGIMPQMP